MWQPLWTTSLLALASILPSALAADRTYQNYITTDELLQQDPFLLYEKRPEDCPPCFNCNLEDFVCQQFANCTKASGKCACPPGFGGDDCSRPLCGSLADGKDRLPRGGPEPCKCKEGWTGVNCNVCETDQACRPLVPDNPDGAVCHREGLVVKENYQMCNITNRKILQMLKEKIPQATFSCNDERKECNFQFWVDQLESFYCALDTCEWKSEATDKRNITRYECENLRCECVSGRFLCGAENSVNLSQFFDELIKGPAEFVSISTEGGSPEDGSKFSEPNMDDLISSIFADESIFLKCHSGECMNFVDVPGYERPVKTINTPLIAGIIAACALFLVAVILLVFFMSRRSARQRRGPIHLDSDEEEENAKLLADHKPASLYFEGVSYNLMGKPILSNITGAVHPGELLAVMGASGAGKTSLLDILARKKKRGMVTGDSWLNGEEIADERYRSVIGFVDQDDTMIPTLTVHETILDSALLRLPKEMSRSAKEQKVEDVERQLGIYHIRHQIIGSEESGRGISGGEKRRVGIACELVTSPSILFLDEPTSGLDSYNAYNVVECLVTLVKTYNRTVVFTIHQPRSNIVALFDQLILLSQGHVVYSGPFGECQNYFDGIGYACPPGFNIADYLVDLTMHASGLNDELEDGDREDVGLLSGGEGENTRASSTRAVKSIPSVSNMSYQDSVGSSGEGATRPKMSKRKTSVRKQQERELFTRKYNAREHLAASSVRSEDEVMDRDADDRSQWLRLSKQQGQPPPQIFDDPHNLPPAVEGATGTNLDLLVAAYQESEVAAGLRNDIRTAVSTAADSNGHALGTPNGNLNGKLMGYRKPGIHTQFAILSRRTWRNIYRNPMLMLTHYAISIVLAVLIGFLFYGLTDDLGGFQNRLGFFFFLLALYGFSTLTSLNVFAPERLIFVRERAKGYYAPIAYYLSKVVFDIVPLRILPPIIMGCITYPMTGLVPAWPRFFIFVLLLVLFNLAAAMICLFIGICVRNQGVANLLGVLVMLFSLLFAGFLLNHETIPKTVLWLQVVCFLLKSMFSISKGGFWLMTFLLPVIHLPLRFRRPHRQRSPLPIPHRRTVRPRHRSPRRRHSDQLRLQRPLPLA